MSLSTRSVDEAELPPVVLGHPEGRARAQDTGWQVVLALAVLAGVVLRAVATSELWRDEALTVNLAGLPVGDMLDALRQDGHPPGYYLLLHAWIDWFGDGNAAVRSLSTVCSVATLPVAWLAGRRLGGRRCAESALVLLATSPFAIRYASEGRMYALVVLLVFAGWLAVRVALERPSPARLGGVALISGLLLLTHYWALYLLAAVGIVLLVAAGRSRTARRPALLVTGAIAAGGVLFLPWAAAMVDQVRTTGTPWGQPARPGALVASTIDGFGGEFGEAIVLGLALVLLVLLALFGRPRSGTSIELDLRTRPAVRAEVAVLVLTLALAATGSYLSGAAFAARYASVVFPLFILAAAFGVTTLSAPTARGVVLAGVALLGLAGGANAATASRTQAGLLAAAITSSAGPGDLVVYCPDQLGPAVSRLLGDRPAGMTFPDGADPRQVDWADYLERARAADIDGFAASADERAGTGAVWLVWSEDYRGLEGPCTAVQERLASLRGAPDVVVIPDGTHEHGWVYRFDAPASRPAA